MTEASSNVGHSARLTLPDDRLRAMALNEIREAAALLWEARHRYNELADRGRRVKGVYDETVRLTDRCDKLLIRLGAPLDPPGQRHEAEADTSPSSRDVPWATRDGFDVSGHKDAPADAEFSVTVRFDVSEQAAAGDGSVESFAHGLRDSMAQEFSDYHPECRYVCSRVVIHRVAVHGDSHQGEGAR